LLYGKGIVDSTGTGLDRHRRLDVRMRVVALELEVLEAKVQQVINIRVKDHSWQAARTS